MSGAPGNTPARSAADYFEQNAILEVLDVHLALGGQPILEGVDLVVRDLRQRGSVRGQIRGIIGPSGVGKTQLLRVIAGLSRADRGGVRVAVDDTGTMQPVRPGMVGVVAQHYPLFAHLTVLQNLSLAGRASGMAGRLARQQAMELLGRFRLDDRARFWPSQLSGGQRQRVAILQQLMVNRFFLVMDEPFSGLDPNAIGAVTDFVREVSNAHELNTLLIISHDIRSVVAICDRVHLLGRAFDESGRRQRAAHVVRELDLLASGIAWSDNPKALPVFHELVNDIEATFKTM
ncbi:MAG: ABC transporter ATP-binding protein [Candidatus Schekmanbacteria bacterium]|nr:ABC transporter ATP-binding protein [Candidatus Schekmanbacteria bacterium]